MTNVKEHQYLKHWLKLMGTFLVYLGGFATTNGLTIAAGAAAFQVGTVWAWSLAVVAWVLIWSTFIATGTYVLDRMIGHV